MLLLLLACEVVDAPACTNDPVHACSTVQVLQSCNQMFVMGGLSVNFTGGTAEVYDAVVTLDGVESALHCEAGVSTGSEEFWGCSESGFKHMGHGDVVEVEVGTAEATFSDRYEPCWDAGEFNGSCCGWTFSTTVELALQ